MRLDTAVTCVSTSALDKVVSVIGRGKHAAFVAATARNVLVIGLAVVAGCSTWPSRDRSPAAPPAPLQGAVTSALVSISMTPVDGAPRGMSFYVDLLFDRAIGLHARFPAADGSIHWTCDGTRAWTLLPSGCSVEATCDEAIRMWFDLGWGYDELVRFIDGELPPTPGWTVTHRRSRKRPRPINSVLRTEGRRFPTVTVGWGGWEPVRVDLAPEILRARTAPRCPPPPPPPPRPGPPAP